MPPFVFRNRAHGKSERHRSIVVEPERIDGLIEINAKGLIGIQTPGFMDEYLGEIGIDSPVAFLVCHGQRISGNLPANTHVIEFVRQGAQTRFNVPEAFSARKLSEYQAEELVPARKSADPVITFVAVKRIGGTRVWVQCP